MMESCTCVLLLAALLTTIVSVCAESSTSSSLVQWKNQLVHFRQWEGHFVYLNVSHPCEMTVHSVQQGSAGVAMVTFTADRIKVDMAAYSDDDISINFKSETAYHLDNPLYEGFAFVVEMMRYGNFHMMIGNITHPASNASSIELRPKGSFITNHHGSSDLSIGLAVGISLFLFVVCTVIGVAILRWAINKGYLRHVAMSYKNFRNPEPAAEPPVTFSADQQQQQDTNPDNVNVHI